MRNAPIVGSDIVEVRPSNGRLLVGGLVRCPKTKITLFWHVDDASGSTTCEAWQGQHEIDCLNRAGYQIERITLA